MRCTSIAHALGLGLLAALGTIGRANACATCGCGDPTLTAMGTEKPFRNRLRASLDARYRTDQIGEPGVDQIGLRELRLDSQLAWAPHERLFLLALVPLLHRRVSYVNDGETDLTALGDIELRAKFFAFVEPSFAPRHLFAVTAGLKVPSGSQQRSAIDGSPLPVEVQPGTGSWDPILGLSYAYFPRPFSLYASAQVTAPLHSRSEFRSGASLRTTTAIQYQTQPWLAPRLGIDTRLDARSYENGVPERDSGGFVGFLSAELLLSPVTDLVLVPSVRVPVIQALAGYHREGPIAGTAIAYDF